MYLSKFGVLAKEIALAREGGAKPKPSKTIKTTGRGLVISWLLLKIYLSSILAYLDLKYLK
jgi:hypothetical protein